MKLKALFLLGFLSATSHAAVSISFQTVALQSDLVTMVTSYYVATVTPSPYFSNTYIINVTGKKSVQPSGPQPCELDKDILLMVRASTWSYVYGHASGQEYERASNVGTIAVAASNCNVASYFGASTKTWSVSTCTEALSNVSSSIYQQSFSSPTQINTGL